MCVVSVFGFGGGGGGGGGGGEGGGGGVCSRWGKGFEPPSCPDSSVWIDCAAQKYTETTNFNMLLVILGSQQITFRSFHAFCSANPISKTGT